MKTHHQNVPQELKNISNNGELPKRAKKLDSNPSDTLPRGLTEQVKIKQAQQWREQNQASIAAYNQSVENQGVFSDGLRNF